MKMVRPAFTFLLLLAVQSLCAQPGVPGKEELTPTAIVATLVTPAGVTSAPQSTASVSPATATPEAESVGTINLVLAQVESGPADNLQFLEGIQDFHSGDGVRVTGGGKGKLDFKDGTQLTLFNNTKLSRVEYSVSPPEADIFLQEEGYLGKVPEKTDSKVILPNGALILILGTRFFVLYNAETQVATAGNFDGLILYTPPGGTEQQLSPGQMVNIPGQGAAELMELPFTPEQFEAAVDSAGTPTAGLTALIQQYQIEPIVFTAREVARVTHADLSSAAFSPDGKYVVSGGCEELTTSCQQGGARIWEATTGGEIRRLIHGQYVKSVAFSPDGRYVATGSCDDLTNICSAGSARVWEVVTGNEVAHMDHTDAVSRVIFSPDGNYVLSQDDSGAVHVWETLTGNEVTHLDPEKQVHSVAFSPDSQYVAVGSTDGIAQVWDLKTNSEVAHKEHGTAPILVAFSPDGKYVVSGSGFKFGPAGKTPGGDVARTAPAGRENARVIRESWMRFVAYYAGVNDILSGRDEQILAQADPYSIIVWEARSGTELARWSSEAAVAHLAFSPNGNYVVAAINDFSGENYSGTVFVWEAASGREVTHMSHNPVVNAIAISPDGNYVASANTRGTLIVWDAFTGRQVALMNLDSTLHQVAFSSDGKYLLSVSEDGTARVWLWQPQ